MAFSFKAAIDISVSAGGGIGGALEATRMFVPLLFAVSIFVALGLVGISFAMYKFRPLPSGEMRGGIERMLSSCKKKIRWLTVYNESAKSNETNAFLLNVPGLRMISIADNAMEEANSERTLAVIAHEIGHLKHTFKAIDMLKFMSPVALCVLIVAILGNTGALFCADAWVKDSFDLSCTSVFLSMQFLSIPLSLFNFLMGIPGNYVQRQKEYEADRNAVLEGYGADLAALLKETSSKELRGVNPHPFIEILEYDHPALPKRLRAIYAEMEALTDATAAGDTSVAC